MSSVALQNLPEESLQEGARIFVTGVIEYRKFQGIGYRDRQQGQIVTNSVILCDESSSGGNFGGFLFRMRWINISSVVDMNEVLLRGYVKRKPNIAENVTFLSVNTDFYEP